MLFFILFLSFCLRVIRKGLRKNSEIFVNLLTRILVFKSVPGCIEGIPGHYGMFGGIMGCSRGVPGLFRAVLGCSGSVPGVFRGVLGVFRCVPGCSGVFRVLQTPPFSITLHAKRPKRAYLLTFLNCHVSF